MKPLRDVGFVGTFNFTADDSPIILHFLQVFYIGDPPEVKELISVKRGVRTASPCHQYLADKHQMPVCKKRTSSLFESNANNARVTGDKLGRSDGRSHV